jgi:hypothetical protein
MYLVFFANCGITGPAVPLVDTLRSGERNGTEFCAEGLAWSGCCSRSRRAEP